MRATVCPSCHEPLNGRECANCGTNPHEVDTDKCRSCGKPVVTDEAEEVQYQKEFSARYVTEYVCSDCQ